ncbi:hypothetical protein EXIGLDRAFT_716905 [Exidia glandulosa HHB12029]|uniref:Uncharacterized protein n=1 Tax=Exidia glandulosa HHB12029 TaxID=1314781 RepID=A0A165INT3_EXIGL|nr:hypothetical protein EXIGLDRAFT_716905 [Exidia glandulosa HHB12029]
MWPPRELSNAHLFAFTLRDIGPFRLGCDFHARFSTAHLPAFVLRDSQPRRPTTISRPHRHVALGYNFSKRTREMLTIVTRSLARASPLLGPARPGLASAPHFKRRLCKASRAHLLLYALRDSTP